jgi:uncharacterized protein involved in exopolysaccharide biosynthesis
MMNMEIDQFDAQASGKTNIEEISIIELAAVIIKRRRLIILTTMVGFVASMLFIIGSYVLPPTLNYLPDLYKPRAIVLIGDTGGGLASMLGDAANLAALAGVSVGNGKSNGDLAVLIAKSNSTIDELNAEFNFTSKYNIKSNIRANTRMAFLKRYMANYDQKTATVSISFEAPDPVFASQVVNRAVEILDRRYSAIASGKAGAQKGLLEQKLADVQNGINKLEIGIQAFTEKYGVINVQAMAAEQITVLARIRSELIMKDIEIENYKKFSRIDDPVVERLRTERDAFAGKIAQIEQGSSLLPSQKDIPELAFEYARFQRDLSIQMEVYKTLTQQYELSKIQADSNIASFQVLELAEIADKKSGPARSLIVVVTSIIAFLGSAVFAFVLNVIEQIRKNPESMKRLRGVA